jgi:ATP-dependent DNA ligase
MAQRFLPGQGGTSGTEQSTDEGDHARRMGLEGIVSKRLDAPYRSGRSGDWIKTKNPDSPAMQRVREGRF